VRRRLDAELVRRGLARSRDHAAELIDEGRVHLSGTRAIKAATQVEDAAPITVAADRRSDGWVSRGGRKLDGALRAFETHGAAPTIAGRRCLDAGAGTGGFTQVLLRRGAAQVVSLDVGYGQLAWELRIDPRVVVVERTNIRHTEPRAIGGPVDLAVADLSFISLRLVLPSLMSLSRPGGDLVLLIKPQFEAGREAVRRGGVVDDPEVRRAAVTAVVEAAHDLGHGLQDVTASPLPGPAGNVEYVAWFAAGPGVTDWGDRIRRAVAAVPGGDP
jgi:23S rRNA (cytidine1920-2'-O)/16S rRNA (cytidine1409-2'-O)-methyltransferase